MLRLTSLLDLQMKLKVVHLVRSFQPNDGTALKNSQLSLTSSVKF